MGTVELAPLRAGAGGGGGGAIPIVDSAPNAAAPLTQHAQSRLTHRPVLRRALQFCGVVLGLVLSAFALSAISRRRSAAPTPTLDAAAASVPAACRAAAWPSPLSYSLLLRLDGDGTSDPGRFRAHSTAVMAIESSPSSSSPCVLLHAAPELAFESVGAAVQQQRQQGSDGGNDGTTGWRDLGLLCGGAGTEEPRDCGSVVARLGRDRVGVLLPAGALSGLPAATTTTTVVVRLRFTYTGRVADSRDQLGLWRAPLTNSSSTPFLSTQLEPQGARRVLPCVDAPAAKATFDVSVALPSPDQPQTTTTALSNGRARTEGGELVWLEDATGEAVEAAEGGASAAGRQQLPPKRRARLFRFSPTPLMSPYLLALAAGDIECTEPLISTPSTAVRVCAARGRAAAVAAEAGGEDGDHPALAALSPALRMASAALAHYSRLTALPYGGSIYPSGAEGSKLDVLLAPGKGGAMENLGLPIFDEGRLLLPPPTLPAADAAANASSSSSSPSSISSNPFSPGAWALWRAADVLCHEVAHQWAGDLATAASWPDLPINEGGATLLEYGCLADALLASVDEEELSPSPRPSWVESFAIAAGTLWAAAPAVPGLSPGVHEGAVARARTADASPLAPALWVAGGGEEDEEDGSADFGPVTYSKGAAVLGMLSALGEEGGGGGGGRNGGGSAAGGAAAAALVPPAALDANDDKEANNPPSFSRLPPFARALARYLRERAFGALALRDAAVVFLLPFAPPPLGLGPGAAAQLYTRVEASEGKERVGRRRRKSKKRRRAAEEEGDDDEDEDGAAAAGGTATAAADAFFRSWAERPGRPVVGVSLEAGPSSQKQQLRVRQARLCAWGLVAPGQEEGLRRSALAGGSSSTDPPLTLECPGNEGQWWLALSAGPLGVGSSANQAQREWLLLPPPPAGVGGDEGGTVVAPAPAFVSAGAASSSTTTWSLHADGGLSGIYYAHHCDARHRAAVRAAAAAEAVAAAAALNDNGGSSGSNGAAASSVNRITRAAALLRDAADVALSPPSLLPAWARTEGDGKAGEEALAAALDAAGAAAAVLSGGNNASSSSLGASLASYSLVAGVALPALRELEAQVWHDPPCRASLRAVARRALTPAVAAAAVASSSSSSSSSSSLASSLLSRMLVGPLLADAALVWRDPAVARKLCASVAVLRSKQGVLPPLASSSLGPDARAAALAAAAASPPGCALGVDDLRAVLERQAKEATAPLLSAEALFALAAGAGAGGAEPSSSSSASLNATLALALGLSENKDAIQFASARPAKAYAADLVVAAARAAVAAVGEGEGAAAAAPQLLGPALSFVLDRWPDVVSSLGEADAWTLLIRLVRSVGGAAPTSEGTAALARALGGGKAVGGSGDGDKRLRAALGAAASRAEWTRVHGKELCELVRKVAEAEAAKSG